MIYNQFKDISFLNQGVLTSGNYVITEPVLLADAKTFLRISDTSQDTLITSLITASRVYCEKFLNKSIVPKTIQVIFSHDGKYSVPLPYTPLADTSAITTVEFRFVSQTAWQDITSNITQWEMVGSRFNSYNPGEYKITYITKADTNNIEVIKLAMKQFITFYYENRGDESLYQLGTSKEAVTVVPDIIDQTLRMINNNTWFG